MKVVIAGAKGQLGQALLATCPQATVIPLTRTEVDFSDSTALASFIEAHTPDVVFNAAAYTAVDRAEVEQDCAQLLNALVPAWLAKASRHVGARFVHVSTDFVFDGASGKPYLPEATTGPLGVYGASKLRGEVAVAEIDPSALIVRTSWVYGVGGSNFVKTMMAFMKSRPEIAVVADQIGVPTHAASLATALWRLSSLPVRGLYHFTDAGVASWYDLAVAVQVAAMEMGYLTKEIPIRPIRTRDYPTPARRPSYSVLDSSRTWDAIGRPAQHWQAELRLMLQGLKETSLV